MPFLLVNKPSGMTSHDVVDTIRKVTRERTVGHAGTLDPFATGLLIIGVTRDATKQLNTFLGMPKTYEATIRLGATSTTLDPEGVIQDVSMQNGTPIEISAEAISQALKKNTGEMLQVPPMHSAIKIGGKKLYDLARKGIEIDRPPRPVTLSRLELLQEIPQTITLPGDIRVGVDCSSGTYIRALARDIGEALGTSAYLTVLTRTAIGPFTVAEASNLSEITAENWRSLAKNLST